MKFAAIPVPANDFEPASDFQDAVHRAASSRHKSRDLGVEPAHPDANLIRLGNTLAIARRMLDAISEQYADADEPTVVAALARDLINRGRVVGDQMADTPARSLDGLRAKAAALLRYSDANDSQSACLTLDEIMGRSIAIDLLGLRTSH